WAVPTGASESGGQSPPYSREVDPADSVERTELHALLRELVEDLPTGQREALDLWADGFTYQEITHITGREEGHVRVLVHRGLKAVREHPQVRALVKDEEDCDPCSRPPEADKQRRNKRDVCSTGN